MSIHESDPAYLYDRELRLQLHQAVADNRTAVFGDARLEADKGNLADRELAQEFVSIVHTVCGSGVYFNGEQPRRDLLNTGQPGVHLLNNAYGESQHAGEFYSGARAAAYNVRTEKKRLLGFLPKVLGSYAVSENVYVSGMGQAFVQRVEKPQGMLADFIAARYAEKLASETEVLEACELITQAVIAHDELVMKPENRGLYFPAEHEQEN